MTWSSFHRRGEVLRAVVTAAEARRDGILPTDVDGVAAVFDDERDLLGALQLVWHTRLMGRIERQQLHESLALEEAVVAAWHEVYADLGGVRAVLDAARDCEDERVRDAMARATAKERLALAVAAGLGNPSGAASVRVGAGIEERARETWSAPYPEVGGEVVTGVWDRVLGRLRAVLAA